MISFKSFVSLIILLLICIPSIASGKTPFFKLPKPSMTVDSIDISAHSLEYDKTHNIYTAKGAVELQEGTRRLTADKVVYTMNSADVEASGNVMYQDGEDFIRCERLTLNLETKTGIIEKGTIYIKQNNFTVVGDHIEKVGDQQYRLKEGQFTTCDMPNPDWKFSARDVDVTIDGYAKTKGMRFHILDKTVLYLPYGLFPVLTKRQSGFLMPEITLSSRDGVKIKDTYFWAIDKDKDATIGLEYIGTRGFKPETEFRYAVKEDLNGTWNFAVINDNKYDHWRYEIKGKHEQTLFKDLRLKTNIDYVSDYAYLADFRDRIEERSENLLKSTAYLEKPFKNSLLTVEGAHFRDLSTKENDTTFKFYPHGTFFTEYLPIIRRVLYADISTDVTNFYREKGNTYSRISIEPRLRLPFSWNGVNFLLSGMLFEKFYYVNESDPTDTSTKNLETVRFDGSTNVQFLRNYNVDFWNIGAIQSLIRPNVQYTFISNNSYRGIPLIDPFDRIGKTNTITYSLGHYLRRLSPQVGGGELSLLEIFQTYGLSGNLPLSDAYKGYGYRFSDITGRLTLHVKRNLSFVHEAALNVHGQGITATSNTLRYVFPDVYYMNISHNYTQGLSNQVDLDLGGKYKFLTGRYRLIYSFRDKEWIDTQYQLVYQAQCWAVILTLKQTKRPNDTSIHFGFDLAGLTGKMDDIDKRFRMLGR